MIELSTALSFFATALLLGYAPGPDIVFVLTQSALHGTRAGLATMCGLITGLCFHTALVSLGIAALIMASPLAFTLIKTAGACYLLWLAWLSWRAGAMRAGGERPPFAGYAALYRRGIIMNITNPKVTMFFLALLPQFCNPASGSVGLQCFELGLIFMLATAVAFGTTSVLAGRIFARFNQTDRGQIIMNRACALIFVTLAVLLLASSI
ncbi:MAG: LysE family translocator [Desulfovibrionaceae bacterium]|nr:LysE family translocator [Desulfovibrionaceae bacterium]